MNEGFPQGQESGGMPAEGQANFLKRMHPVAFAILALGIVFLLYQVVAGLITLLLFRGTPSAESVNPFRVVTILGQLLFILSPTLFLAWARAGNLREYFRLRVPDLRQVVVVLIAVFALQQILQAYIILQDAVPLPPRLQEVINQIKEIIEQAYRLLVTAHDPGEFLFVVFAVALVPAVSEEFLFRGLVQRSFEASAGGVRGAVIAGIVFAAYHLNPFSIIPLIALGVFFGYIVYRSQNITIAVAAHFFNNFIACLAVYLSVDDDFVLLAPKGNATVLEVAANTAVFAAVFVAATVTFVLLTRGRQGAATGPGKDPFGE
jgi:membrane protease YdiL (CAAX protease family)